MMLMCDNSHYPKGCIDGFVSVELTDDNTLGKTGDHSCIEKISAPSYPETSRLRRVLHFSQPEPERDAAPRPHNNRF
jgi:hypothetical protein